MIYLENVLDVLPPVSKMITINGKEKKLVMTHRQLIFNEFKKQEKKLKVEAVEKKMSKKEYREKWNKLRKKHYMDTAKKYITKYGHLVK
jgi:hypothetical protein